MGSSEAQKRAVLASKANVDGQVSSLWAGGADAKICRCESVAFLLLFTLRSSPPAAEVGVQQIEVEEVVLINSFTKLKLLIWVGLD